MLTVFEIAVLCLFLYYNIFSFIIIVRFLSVPEITAFEIAVFCFVFML